VTCSGVGKEHTVGTQPRGREAGEFSQRQKAGERCPRQRGRPVWSQGVNKSIAPTREPKAQRGYIISPDKGNGKIGS